MTTDLRHPSGTTDSAASTAKPGRVLVVDDEQDIVVILSYILNKAGFEVYSASNGRDALKSVGSDDIELILLDYMLPDINGLDVLRNVKMTKPDVDVIIVTGRGSDKVHEDVMRAGATDYVVKPFMNDMLVELAGKTIAARRARLDGGES